MFRRLLIAGALLLATLPLALAHEHVEVADGRYELTFGWRTEPAFVGEPNGLDLKIDRLAASDVHAGEDDHESDHGNETSDEGHAAGERTPVLGQTDELTVTYEYAGKTFEPLNLRAAFGRPGWYTADITPTRPGVYTIHVTGTIEGHAVDVRVEPHEVEDLDETSFPEADPPYYELVAKVAELEAKVAKLETDARTQIENPPPTTDAKNDAPAAGAVAALGVILFVGLALRRR